MDLRKVEVNSYLSQKKELQPTLPFCGHFSNDLSTYLNCEFFGWFSPRSPSSPSFSRGRLYRASLPRLGSFNTGCGLGRWPTGAGALQVRCLACNQTSRRGLKTGRYSQGSILDLKKNHVEGLWQHFVADGVPVFCKPPLPSFAILPVGRRKPSMMFLSSAELDVQSFWPDMTMVSCGGSQLRCQYPMQMSPLVP